MLTDLSLDRAGGQVSISPKIKLLSSISLVSLSGELRSAWLSQVKLSLLPLTGFVAEPVGTGAEIAAKLIKEEVCKVSSGSLSSCVDSWYNF